MMRGTYTAQVDYGDGTEVQELLLNPGNTFDLQHQYCDNGIVLGDCNCVQRR